MKYTKGKEMVIFKLATEILDTHGDRVASMDLIESDFDNDNQIKIYHGNGHCFELEQQRHCEPDKVDNFDDIHDLQKDGCTYYFNEPWDGYTEIGIDKAIDLLSEYAKIES